MSSYIVATTLAVVFGVVILLTLILSMYVLFCYTITFASKTGDKDLESQTNLPIEDVSVGKCLTTSDAATNGGRIVSVSPIPKAPLSNPSLNEYQDAKGFLCSFAESISSHQKLIDRTPEEFIDMDINNPTIISTQMVSPENQTDVNKFDSFSKTLMIQNLIEKAIKKESQNHFIRKVEDKYSSNFIEIGEIVVVVKPFFGIEGYEFSCLQPGDLLRVVKFYVRTQPIREFSSKSIHLVPNTANFFESTNTLFDMSHSSDIPEILPTDLLGETPDGIDEEEMSTSSPIDALDVTSKDSATCMKKDGDDYSKLYCTGIMLNTYLEFDNEKSSLRLKFKTQTRLSQSEAELLKDFPLSVISLETTVLNSIK